MPAAGDADELNQQASGRTTPYGQAAMCSMGTATRDQPTRRWHGDAPGPARWPLVLIFVGIVILDLAAVTAVIVAAAWLFNAWFAR